MNLSLTYFLRCQLIITETIVHIENSAVMANTSIISNQVNLLSKNSEFSVILKSVIASVDCIGMFISLDKS